MPDKPDQGHCNDTRAESLSPEQATRLWNIFLSAPPPADRQALDRLYRALRHPLVGFYRLKGCDPELADEIAEAAFIRLIVRTRSHTATPSATVEPRPDWVAQALSEDRVQAAVARQREARGEILFELSAARLTFDADQGLAVTPTIDESAAPADGLTDMVTTDREANERIVDALARTLPGASPGHRRALRRALNVWRTGNAFGLSAEAGAAPPTGH